MELTAPNPEKNKERSTLCSHATRISPEWLACEQRLCCVVEGIDRHQLLIRFSHLHIFDLDREFSFVIDVSTRFYKGWQCFHPFGYFAHIALVSSVITSTPSLPTLPILIGELNQSRNVYSFIQKIRCAFIELMQT
jgi:kinetochore protein Spc25, fungi type